MIASLKEKIDEFIEDRMNPGSEVGPVISKYPEYHEAQAKLEEVVNVVLERLGEDIGQSWINGTGNEIDEVICKLTDVHERAAYIRGFKDAMQIKYI